MEEIWKDIPEFEGLYQVSNKGKVISIKNGICKEKKPSCNRNNYPMVLLYKNNIPKGLYVHRIVATCFIENPFNKKTVNHKNGDKKDNNVSNLEWFTYSENHKHSFECLGRKSHMKGKYGELNPNSTPIYVVMKNRFKKRYGSMTEASKALGISLSLISLHLKNGSSTKQGYEFKKA